MGKLKAHLCNCFEPVPNKPEVIASSVPDNEQSLPRIRWVIGLDFGTTYSGFAYSRVLDNPEIYDHYGWPRREVERHYCKTLTGLYYKRAGSDGLKCASWGYSTRSEYMDSCSQGHYLTKFKLLLKKDLNDPALAASIPPPLTLDAIITEYLKQIGEHALSCVRNHDGEANFRRDSVQWCVTVPSIWDENAKQLMRVCMVNAGLVSAETGGTDAVIVALEPEAASIHCHQILRLEHKNVSLNVKDKILVADAGGGTVDIVVQELVGSNQNYQVKEVTKSSGGFCGGTFVDKSFLKFLSEKIGCLDEFLRDDCPTYQTRLLKDWEETKCAFGHKTPNRDTMSIVLDRKLASRWEAYETGRGNALKDSSVVVLTEQDLQSIFDPVVNEILDLIAAQLTQVPGIKVMFVVGGFACSPYLMQRIRARFSGEVRHIVSPPLPGRAVVHGAVALALHPDAIVSRIAKKTYGTNVVSIFDENLDPPHLRRVTNGVKYCRNRFDVFVKKGSRVQVDRCVTKTYVPHTRGQTQILFDLYSSSEQEPRYTEGATVTREGAFLVDLPKNYNRSELPVFDYSMYFGRAIIELKASAKYSGIGGQEATTLVVPVRWSAEGVQERG